MGSFPPIHREAHPQVGIGLGIVDGPVVAHAAFGAVIHEIRLSGRLHYLHRLQEQGFVVATFEEKSVGIVIVKKKECGKPSFLVERKMFLQLLVQAFVALQPTSRPNLTKQDVAELEVEHAIQHAAIVVLDRLLADAKKSVEK